MSIVLNKVNLQTHVRKPCSMDGTPLLTMVKAQTLTEPPELDEASTNLDRTLTMLCSFLSLGDFMSFLASKPFESYARTDEPWVMFEVGLYVDHTKTLQLIPKRTSITLVDPSRSGVFEDGLVECWEDSALRNALNAWLSANAIQ